MLKKLLWSISASFLSHSRLAVSKFSHSSHRTINTPQSRTLANLGRDVIFASVLGYNPTPVSSSLLAFGSLSTRLSSVHTALTTTSQNVSGVAGPFCLTICQAILTHRPSRRGLSRLLRCPSCPTYTLADDCLPLEDLVIVFASCRLG